MTASELRAVERYLHQLPKALDHAVEQGWIASWTAHDYGYRLVYNDHRVATMTPEMAAGWFEGVAYAMGRLAPEQGGPLSITT